MTTKKNKEQFEKWYAYHVYSDTHHILGVEDFYKLPLSMQWGVYLEYYNNIEDKPLHIEIYNSHSGYGFIICKGGHNGTVIHDFGISYDTMEEAQTEALKEVDEIENSRIT